MNTNIFKDRALNLLHLLDEVGKQYSDNEDFVASSYYECFEFVKDCITKDHVSSEDIEEFKVLEKATYDLVNRVNLQSTMQ